MACFRVEAGAIVIAVRLTPRGGSDAIDGVGTLADGREVVLARVRAAPEDGAANAALVALLAKTFGRPKSAVEVVRGASARLKEVRIGGAADELAGVVARWKPKRV